MWSVRLSDAQRDALRGLIEAHGVANPALTGAREALELARWDDLPEASLPWERVVEFASTQGIGEADVVWDLACGMRGGVRSSAEGAAARASHPGSHGQATA
jgi:hypothetical protein